MEISIYKMELNMGRERESTRKRRKTLNITHNRVPSLIYVTSTDELVYITAERGHLGVMLSELDELGGMIYRRCIEKKTVVEFKGVIYMPPTIKPCDEDFRKLWIQSAQWQKMMSTT